MRRFFARLRDRVRRRQLVAAFDEEMAFHLDQLTEEYQRRGYTPEAARAAAQREFGNTTLAREDLRAQAGWRPLDELGRDVTLAARSLRRRPGFALGTMLILALGFAAAITLLVLADAILFRPLPVPYASELYRLRPVGANHDMVSAGTARRLQAALPPEMALAGQATPSQVNVVWGAAPAERAQAQLVVGDYFAALGLQPVAGRLLQQGDDTVGQPASVVVVNEAWARGRFGEPRLALGQELLVNRHPVTVIGVVPAEFRGLEVGGRTHLWLPAALAPAVQAAGNVWSISRSDRPNHPDWNQEERVSWINLVVRAPRSLVASMPGRLQAAAQPEWEQLEQALEEPSAREALRRRTWAIEAIPGGYGDVRERFVRSSGLVGGIVMALLVLTAANVSSLLLVRALTRHRELGVRLALGAGKWRVGALVVTEALWLGLGGTLLGWLISAWLLPVAAASLAPGAEVQWALVPGRVALGVLALTAVMAAGCAWVPTRWILRLDPMAALGGRLGGGVAPLRLVRGLVALQVALAVVLVAVAFSLGQHLRRVLAVDLGFTTETVLTLRFDAAAAGYTSETMPPLTERLEARLREVPGVSDVAFAANGLLAGSVGRSALYPRNGDEAAAGVHHQGDVVSPAYLRATGLTLLRGRPLQEADSAEAPRVAVVTSAFARQLFGREDAVGERFGFGRTPGDQDFTIVGVLADIRANTVEADPPPMFFVPAAQGWRGAVPSFLAVRVTTAPDQLALRLREVLRQTEPGIVWPRWHTLADRVANDVRGRTVAARLMTVLAGVALLLAGVGIGVSLAHLVALRRREIAVRMALGADAGAIVRAVLRDAARLAGAGAAVGLLVAWAAAQVPVLVGIFPAGLSGGALLTAALAAVVAAVAGAWRPARQAVRTDPQQLLQAE